MPQRKVPTKRLPWEAIGAIAGVIGVIVAILAYRAQVAGTHTPPSSPQGITTTATQSSEPASHAIKDIVLHQHAGVDVDGAEAVIASGLSGITGVNDVYHDASSVSSSRLYTSEGLYVYKGNPAQAYSNCMAYLADTTHTLDSYSTLDVGRAACFKSSDGRLVFLQMTALNGSPGNYSSVTFNVKVWDK